MLPICTLFFNLNLHTVLLKKKEEPQNGVICAEPHISKLKFTPVNLELSGQH